MSGRLYTCDLSSLLIISATGSLAWAISLLRYDYRPNKVITVNLVWRHVRMTSHVF